MYVPEDRSSWSQFPFEGLANVSSSATVYMCGRSKQSSAVTVTVPVTETAQTCTVSCYQESVVMGSFEVYACCTLVSLPDVRTRCHDRRCGAYVFVRAQAKSSWSCLGLW